MWYVICMYQITLWSKLFWPMMVIHNVYCSQFNKRDKDHNINFNFMLSSSDCSLTSNYALWAPPSNTFYGYFSKECTCTKSSYFLKGKNHFLVNFRNIHHKERAIILSKNFDIWFDHQTVVNVKDIKSCCYTDIRSIYRLKDF